MIEPSDLRVNSYALSFCGPSQKTGWPTEVARLWRSLGEIPFPLPVLVSRNASQTIIPTATASAMTAPVRKRTFRRFEPAAVVREAADSGLAGGLARSVTGSE